ncbi:MAG TPA: glycosyltransferase family 4 protein, partial [Alphaproteobacteria bacterium]|nr:glycosyltransferase family 4 protein [Alphaproteobacteria bacterium]
MMVAAAGEVGLRDPGAAAAPGAVRPHLVHVFPSFAHGGVPLRIATVMNHLGNAYRHTVVAMDGRHDARSRLDRSLSVAYETVTAARYGLVGTVGRLSAALRRLRPSLLLTYNWGAIEWALANTLAPVCPHLHLESGFGLEEAAGRIRRRAVFRRLALARAAGLVVPSRCLVRIATEEWRIPERKIHYIPNGVDLARFAAPHDPGLTAGLLGDRPGVVIGTVAPLRPEKGLHRLLNVFAGLAADGLEAKLLIVGEGSERPRLNALASSLGIADRVVFAGHVDAVERIIGAIDVFVITSDTEQMPNALLQAMAAGRPVASVDVGDIREILPVLNRPFIVPVKAENQLGAAVSKLISDVELRRALGAVNREHVANHYAVADMFDAYTKLFEAVLDRR